MPERDDAGRKQGSVSEEKRIAVDYSRGLMGGMLVGLPSTMTMEMWWEGFFVPASRLLLLLLVNLGVLLVLQYYSGLTHKKTFGAQARAAVVAYGLGLVVSFVMLFALGVLHGDIHLRELAGKLALEAVPVSIGSSVAMSEFGDAHREIEQRRKYAGYWGALGMALAGAMLFGFSVSSTEELIAIADQLTPIRAMLLMVLSLLQVHAIVYAVDFKQRPDDVGTRQHTIEVIREGVSTYALSLAVGAFLLWTFRTLNSGLGLMPSIYATIALGTVTSLGAGAAELLI